MAKKKYLVMSRTEKALEGLDTGAGKIKFNGKTGIHVSDPGIAREIDQRYGLKGSGDVWVEQDEKLENHVNYHTSDGVHNYFFGPTQAFRDGWERIFGDGTQGATRSTAAGSEETSTESSSRKQRRTNHRNSGKSQRVNQ